MVKLTSDNQPFICTTFVYACRCTTFYPNVAGYALIDFNRFNKEKNEKNGQVYHKCKQGNFHIRIKLTKVNDMNK